MSAVEPNYWIEVGLVPSPELPKVWGPGWRYSQAPSWVGFYPGGWEGCLHTLHSNWGGTLTVVSAYALNSSSTSLKTLNGVLHVGNDEDTWRDVVARNGIQNKLLQTLKKSIAWISSHLILSVSFVQLLNINIWIFILFFSTLVTHYRHI